MGKSLGSSGAGSSKSYVLSCDTPAPAAMRFPAVKKHKDTAENRRATLSRDCSVKVIDFMVKQLNRSSELWTFVEQLMKQGETPDATECWSNQYRKIWRIGAGWWAEWLGDNGGDDLPATTVAMIFNKDERAVKAIGLFACGLSADTRLPEVLLNKQLAARVFTKLAEQKAWFLVVGSAIDFKTGAIKWTKMSSYKVHWGKDGCADFIEYANKDKVDVAKGRRFSNDFKIRDPISDKGCTAVGPGEFKVAFHKLFPIGKGPHLMMEPDDGLSLEAMGVEAQVELDEGLKRARSGEADDEASHLEKARAAVKHKRAKVEVDFNDD